jgi:hypothetical protein
VNSQNTQTWLTEDPHAAHDILFHPLKIKVWCAVSCCRIVGPIFFEDTIYSEHYIDVVHEFLGQLTEEDIAEASFQQESVTCHTAWVTIR